MLEVTATQPTSTPPVHAFDWVCPVCSEALTQHDVSLTCTRGHRFVETDGIWDFRLETELPRIQRFEQRYTAVRQWEGWHNLSGPVYANLPSVPADHPLASIWAQRTMSFGYLTHTVVDPLATRMQRPLRIVDLGAGNGWLACQLARRGHHVLAVDVQADRHDGLATLLSVERAGASSGTVTPVLASYDTLPLAPAQFDLAIFNASLHYARDVERSLQEALLVLTQQGLLAVMDSPVYRAAASGRQMVAEREQAFAMRLGLRREPVDATGFLSSAQLYLVAFRLGIRWQRHDLGNAAAALARRTWRRLVGQREVASLPVLVGQRVSLLQPRAPGVVRGASRRWLRLRYRPHDSLPVAPARERVAGFDLTVLPGVFNPRILRTGQFLANAITDSPLRIGDCVLDLGTGTGIGALAAARTASRVVATDISPDAVACARANVERQGLAGRIDVRLGDLFVPVARERFDTILFNPPYYAGQPKDWRDHAWRSLDVPDRFARELSAHLSPLGCVYLVLSTDAPIERFLEPLRTCGYVVTLVQQQDHWNESLGIFAVRLRWEG